MKNNIKILIHGIMSLIVLICIICGLNSKDWLLSLFISPTILIPLNFFIISIIDKYKK